MPSVQGNIYDTDAMCDSNRNICDSLEDVNMMNNPTNSSSSWRLLKNIFGASRGFTTAATNRPKDGSDWSPKKQRRVSCDVHSDINSPTAMLRRLSVGRQRKVSSTKSPSRARKFSAINSQEHQLHYFVSESDSLQVKCILENGKVDINFMRPPGLSPLHIACILGDLDIVEILTQRGADINLRTSSGLSPVQITTLFGHFDVAQYLISIGASSREIEDGFRSDTKLMLTVLSMNN